MALRSVCISLAFSSSFSSQVVGGLWLLSLLSLYRPNLAGLAVQVFLGGAGKTAVSFPVSLKR